MQITCIKILLPVFLGLCILYFPANLYAQNRYAEGYVITMRGDTLEGKIRDRKSEPFARRYKRIRFRSSMHSSRRYRPGQIRGYAIGSAIYESHWLMRDNRGFQERYLSMERYGKPVFLRLVVKGPLSLYFLEQMDQDSGRIDYVELFKKEDDPVFVRVSQGLLGLKKGMLRQYLADRPDVIEKINDKTLRSALEIVKYYNEQ
ncbi:MAG: hypothetical protein JJU28_06385 [Cyclobacteriaceae bacterium]|nr:hypothetical protein [Cyclobacteriaceae bacterium]